MFAMKRCPSCKKLKALLIELGLSTVIKVLDLDDPSVCSGSAKQIKDYINRKYEVKTVPQMFVNGVHVGGAADIINCLA